MVIFKKMRKGIMDYSGIIKARGGGYSGKGKRTGSPGHYQYQYDEPKGRDKKEPPGDARIQAANTAAINYFNAEKDPSVEAVEDMTALAYAPDAHPKMKALEGWTKAMGLEAWDTGMSDTSAYVTIQAPGEDLFSDVKVRFSDHGNMGSGHANRAMTDVNIARGTGRDFVTGIREALDTLLDRLEMDEEDEPGYEAAVAHIKGVREALAPEMRKGIMDYSDIVKAHKYKKRTGLQIKLIKGFQSHTDMPKVGDKVKNTNPGCVHYKSEGVVTGIKDVPGGKGKTISYRCTNDGSKWKRGDTLDKTPDQLSPMKKHIDCGKCLGARRG